ncbi:zinc alcohol dehydrogenase [Colletotrichum karsti]|uniref:Zinc alcohol dehydrogenase n=1 Tax=Colletotrichum karsti TaxID=1095194 RepID=A0A9P6LEE4_9PEZI|nr:zinc alcohol dehydrogenase [Colletotrichum karsti]KAF9873059.1 zinc alcohol dehydrogenase [Colletotrichum karsti]
MPETMRIWQYSTLDRNLEDCLTLKEDAPIPSKSSLRKNELLVEVISASLNPADYKVPATPVIGRLMVSRPATPGMDFCGRVAGKHPSNTAFEEGQIVFGGLAMINQRGVLGQFIVIDGAVCAPLPKGIDPDQGASVGTAATTAYQSLMPDKLKPGAKVFINGGSGGTGTWGIQIAKALGAEVVTTCSTANVDLCRQLGADEVIDYKTEDVLTNLKARGNVFDLVIDNVGSTAGLYDNCSRYLKKGGTFVLVGVGPNVTLSGIFWTLAKQVRPTILGGGGFYFVQQKNTTEYFQRLGKWMTEAKMKAVIDSEFAFEDVPEAYRKLREGRTKGKIVVHVGSRGDAA